jgi:hypothetical protein
MSTLDDEVARMTKGLFDNAKDVFDIWMFQPHRHGEFGVREIQDIRDVVHGLTAVLKSHDKQSALKVVSR